jgi:vanillate monooxygenase ferredoxin subunit
LAICGTCVTRVLDGVPHHRDRYLTPEERDTGDVFTPCCSRARTPVLVVDL